MDDTGTGEAAAPALERQAPAAGDAAAGRGNCYLCGRPVTNQNGTQKVCAPKTPPPPGQERRCILIHRARKRARPDALDVLAAPALPGQDGQVAGPGTQVVPGAAIEVTAVGAKSLPRHEVGLVCQSLLRLDQLAPRDGLEVARQAAELLDALNPVAARLALDLAQAEHDQRVTAITSELEAVKRQLAEEQRRATVLGARLDLAEQQSQMNDVDGLAHTADALDDEVQRLQGELDLEPVRTQEAVRSAVERTREELELELAGQWRAREAALRAEHERALDEAIRLAVSEAVERTRLEVATTVLQEAARDTEAQLAAARQHDADAHREELRRLAATSEQHHERLDRLHAAELDRLAAGYREAIDRLSTAYQAASQRALLPLEAPLEQQPPGRQAPTAEPIRLAPQERSPRRRSPAPRDPLPAEPDPAAPLE